MGVSMSLTVHGQSAQLMATTKLSHFGAAVSIVAPPPSEVTDLTRTLGINQGTPQQSAG
jgi:hypothetical protein